MELTLPSQRSLPGGTCAVCLQPTDTGLRFSGEVAWVIAALSVLGVPTPEGADMVALPPGPDPAPVPGARRELTVHVCDSCAIDSGAPFPKPVRLGAGYRLPCVRQH